MISPTILWVNFNGTWDIRPFLEKDIFTKKISSDGSGKNWVAEYQIKDGDVVDGRMEFQITGFQDIAGNSLLSPSILTEDDHQKSVAVDTSSPRVPDHQHCVHQHQYRSQPGSEYPPGQSRGHHHRQVHYR